MKHLKVADFEQVKIVQDTFSPETYILLYNNGLAIQHGLPNIEHKKL